MVDELAAVLSNPDFIMCLALIVGAFVIGIGALACMVYAARWMGWLQ